ncbi:E3 ubiquitin-protein ligase p28-like protein [Goatpox virus]|uniref:Host range factor p28 n=1 Tax=Goatpox virus TaxID=186805 RepID=A0A5C0PRS3_9POXV|nr:E3 ubiquitin-protein ligase p28-like protein [Goatpox virus]
MDSDSRNGFILLNYQKVKVIIVLSNNYINITKLCKPMGKSFHNWWNLKSSYQIICNIAKEEDIKVENLSFNVWKGQKTKEVYGKYIHPKLLVYILNWISEDYCAKILSIINEFNSKILNNINTNTKINKIYTRLPKEESMFNAIFNKENSKSKNYKKFLINIPTILSKYEKYFLESKEKECAVCLENVYDKEYDSMYFGILPGCDHVFCIECINIWKKENSTCPVCRNEFLFVIKSRFFP